MSTVVTAVSEELQVVFMLSWLWEAGDSSLQTEYVLPCCQLLPRMWGPCKLQAASALPSEP